MSKTQRLSTGRSAQFADTADAGNAASHEIVSIVKTDGDLTSLNPLTGSTINFTTGRDGTALFAASFYTSGFQIFSSATLAINIDGTDYTLNVQASVNGAGGDRNNNDGVSGTIGIPLTAGNHTAYLNISSGGLGIVCSAGNPITLTIVYPTVSGAVAPASPLSKQETGPFAATVNPPDSNYIVVASSAISVTFSTPQVVNLSAYATFVDPGSNSVSGQLGIRVTSPGPVTVDYDGSQARGGNDVNYAGSSLVRAVQLAAGTHTIELLVRNPASGATFEYTGAFLTVVYTVPQVITTGIDVLANFHSDTDIPPDGLQQTICNLPFTATFAQSIIIDFSAFNMVVHKGNNITVTYKIDSGTEKNGCRVNLENLNPTVTTDEPFGANGAFRRYEAVSAGAHTLHVFANVEIDNPSPSDGVGGIKAPIDVLIMGK